MGIFKVFLEGAFAHPLKLNTLLRYLKTLNDTVTSFEMTVDILLVFYIPIRALRLYFRDR